MEETEVLPVSTENQSVEVVTESSEPTWWIDEKVPGVGDRPDWMPEKFKTVSDMSKSYSELEKKFGSAPKEYDFSKASEWLDVESDSMKNLAESARAKGIPQEFMDSMMENIGEQMKVDLVDEKAEIEKLGEHGKERLDTLNNWAQANLSEDAFKALSSSMNTADAVMAMEEVRKMVNDSMTQVPTEGSSATETESIANIQDEMTQNFDKYQSDTKYRESLKNRMEKIASQSDYTDKSMS